VLKYKPARRELKNSNVLSYMGPKLDSDAGGQLDFIYGASRSNGGMPIPALPSTAIQKKWAKKLLYL
jgi:acyl-CoA hydrolase